MPSLRDALLLARRNRAQSQQQQQLGEFRGTVRAIQEEQLRGAEAFSELALPGFREQIGRALGDVFAVSGRSGALTKTLEQFNREAANIVANRAALASSEAIGHALGFGQLQLQREQFKAQKKGGLFSAIGGLLGRGLNVVSQFTPGGVVGKVAAGLAGK